MSISKQKLGFWLFVVGTLFVLLTGALFISLHESWHPRKVAGKLTQPMTDVELRKWYAGYNEEYFLNQLPKNTEVHWTDLTSYGEMGEVVQLSGGQYVIRIDRRTNPVARQAKLTLIHEQCHIAQHDEFDMHGPKFRACMIHVALHGGFDGLW